MMGRQTSYGQWPGARSPKGGREDDPSIIRNVLADLTLREIEIVPHRTAVLVRALSESLTGGDASAIGPNLAQPLGALRSAMIPSILLQLAITGDKMDADNLASEQWRENIVKSIVGGFDEYFSQQLVRCDGEAQVGNEMRCLRPKDTFKDCPDCPEMVVVPAGQFTMGSPANEPERSSDEAQV